MMDSDTESRRAGVIDWVQFVAVRSIEGLLRLLPLRWIYRIGSAGGWCAYWFAGPYRKLAIRNLGIAFGAEMDLRARHELARRHFSRLGANLLCGFKLPLMSPEVVLNHVEIVGLENIRAADQGRNNIVYAVCHLSCWEVLTQVPRLFAFGRKLGSIYQALANPLLNRLVLDRRQKLGYRLFDRAEGFTGPMKFVKEGGCLGVLVDQHAGDHGVWAPFFGRLASTTPLPVLLARRANALLLPMALETVGVGHWRMRCLPPVDLQGGIELATARLNRVVEGMVRRDPLDWFWVHNRWKTPKPNFLLHGYKRGVALADGQTNASLQRFEVLVRSPNWLGDACMAFPAIKALKSGRPDLRLTVLGPEKLRELWATLPEVDAYIGKGNKVGVRRVADDIRATGVAYDVAILLTHSIRSTLEIKLAGIPRLIGYRGSLRKHWLHQVCAEPPSDQQPLHHSLKYLRLVEHCGADVTGQELGQTVGGATTRACKPLRIGLCAGAEYGPAKRWPLQHYAEVANRLTESIDGIEWRLYGAPGEVAMGEALSSMLIAKHENLVGQTSLSELIADLETCALLVTNDTGTMHLAAALGVPTVSIFGSTEPSLTGPLGDHHRIIRHHVPCSPCFRRECPFGHYDCMTGIQPNRVIEEILQALAKSAEQSPQIEVARATPEVDLRQG